MRWIIIMLLLMAVIPIVSAVTVQEGDVIINTTTTNTTYLNNLNSTTQKIVIENDNITFSGISYTNGELGVNILHNFTLDLNQKIDNTTNFPFLNYSDNFTKNISNFVNITFNATLGFDFLNCQNRSFMNYTSAISDFKYSLPKVNITCTGNRVSGDFIIIEPSNETSFNQILINYKATNWEMAVILSLLTAVYITNTSLNSWRSERKQC